MERQTDKLKVNNIPNTQLRQDIISISLPSWQKFIKVIKQEFDDSKLEVDDSEDAVEFQTKYRARELFVKYQEWCRETGEHYATTETKFFMNVKKIIDTPKKTREGMIYDISTIKLS